jgi:cytochrome bd-type quinol oxidase subunit 2
MLLPGNAVSQHAGLDIYNAASPAGSLRTALIIYVIGITIVTVYLVNIYRIWGGKAGTLYH